MSGGEGVDIEALKVALLKVEGNRPDYSGIRTQWYRNPEGPEAWAVIEALQAERDDYEQLSRAASGEADVLRARIAELEAELAGARRAGQAYIVFRDDVLEEAAKVAEERHEASGLGWTPHAIATAIRNLKEPPHA